MQPSRYTFEQSVNEQKIKKMNRIFHLNESHYPLAIWCDNLHNPNLCKLIFIFSFTRCRNHICTFDGHTLYPLFFFSFAIHFLALDDTFVECSTQSKFTILHNRRSVCFCGSLFAQASLATSLVRCRLVTLLYFN